MGPLKTPVQCRSSLFKPCRRKMPNQRNHSKAMFSHTSGLIWASKESILRSSIHIDLHTNLKFVPWFASPVQHAQYVPNVGTDFSNHFDDENGFVHLFKVIKTSYNSPCIQSIVAQFKKLKILMWIFQYEKGGSIFRDSIPDPPFPLIDLFIPLKLKPSNNIFTNAAGIFRPLNWVCLQKLQLTRVFSLIIAALKMNFSQLPYPNLYSLIRDYTRGFASVPWQGAMVTSNQYLNQNV